MGILLPPISQVTNTRINMTQHHRNRSLDSALQRIPEVRKLLINKKMSCPCQRILIILSRFNKIKVNGHSTIKMTVK